MPFKNNPGCSCCDGIVETCTTKYLSGWRFGTGNVVKTIHQDFTATYVDYTQREEREYDASNNLISTTLISQTYPNAYSSPSSITESVENDKFYSGEFIAGHSDSFKSESLVSTAPQPGGGKIDTYDVVYDRSASIRVSNGVALFEGNHPQLSSFSTAGFLTPKEYWISYSNQSLGTFTEDVSTVPSWRVIGNSASRIWPTGYSVDPDNIGDGNETVYVTFSSGVSNATATAANSKSAVDALRGSGSAGNDSLTYYSSYNVDSEWESSATVYANGSDHSICVIGQKNPTVNGPAGSGFSKQNFSFGYETFYNNYTPFSSQETRPQVTLWDFIDSKTGTASGTNGPTAIEFTVPADSGIRIKYAREVYHDAQYVKLFDSSKSNPFLVATGLYQYLAGQASGRDTYGPLSVADRHSPDDLWEHKGFTPGAYPWPLTTSRDYLFSEMFEVFPQKPAGSGLNTNLVSIRVDSAIAPTYRIHDDSTSPKHFHFDPTSKTRFISGIPSIAGISSDVWDGGDYVCEITDYSGFMTIDYVEIVQFDQTLNGVACDEIIGCSDTLALTSNNLVHRSTSVRFDRSDLYGGSLGFWLYQNTSPPESYPTSYNFDQRYDWLFEETLGCTTSATWHFDGSTYTTNLPVIEASVSLSGPMDDVSIDLTIELVRLHSAASIDGPYSMTMDGIDLTAISGTSIRSNAGSMSIELGVDYLGNYGRDKFNVWSSSDFLGGGTFSSGSSPFPLIVNGTDTYTIALNLNDDYT